MSFHEDYAKEEFQYNEDQPEPLDCQHDFFEKPDALYFEREWRMILEGDIGQLCWEKKIDGKWYFEFSDKFLDNVILPESYVSQFIADQNRIFADYSHFPKVLAFEDLKNY
jgi:hypothetical protein